VITYREARALVATALARSWREGTFCIDDRQIIEDDDAFLFPVGPREQLVDGDQAYATFGGGVVAVVKSRREVVWVPEVRLIPRLASLRVRPNPDAS
jgi:hypothetical protein